MLAAVRLSDARFGIGSVKFAGFCPAVSASAGDGDLTAKQKKALQSAHLAAHTLHTMAQAYKEFRSSSAAAASRTVRPGGQMARRLRFMLAHRVEAEPQAAPEASAASNISVTQMITIAGNKEDKPLPFPTNEPQPDSDNEDGQNPSQLDVVDW